MWYFTITRENTEFSLVAQMVKNLPANTGDMGSIPGLGRYPEGGNGCPLQYSCLQSSMDRGAWWAAVCGVTKSQTPLSNYPYTLLSTALPI